MRLRISQRRYSEAEGWRHMSAPGRKPPYIENSAGTSRHNFQHSRDFNKLTVSPLMRTRAPIPAESCKMTASTCASKYRAGDKFQLSLGSMTLALMMAACAGTTAVQPSNTTPPPVTSFDGSYADRIRVTGMSAQAAGTNWCETRGQPVITVSNGQFSYAVPHPNVPGNPTPTFAATVAQDGSFNGQANNGTISGQLRGSHIEGSISGEGCNYSFSGDRM